MQSGGRHRDQRIAGPDPVRAEQPVGLHYSGRGAGQVEVIGTEVAGVLGRLTADEGAPGPDAAFRDAADNGRHPLRPQRAADHVVGHEQRLGTAGHEIVDDHGHQVDADGVVPAHPLGNHHLRADAVGRGRQQRPPVAREPGGIEQPGKSADAAHHLGPGGPGDRSAHQVDGPLPGLDVNARARVARAGPR